VTRRRSSAHLTVGSREGAHSPAEYSDITAELRDAETVLAQLSAWFEDYNTRAPHSALGMRSPAKYRAEQLTLSSSR
jgi:transposase InsO family protein